jgi:hypothetical protein
MNKLKFSTRTMRTYMLFSALLVFAVPAMAQLPILPGIYDAAFGSAAANPSLITHGGANGGSSGVTIGPLNTTGAGFIYFATDSFLTSNCVPKDNTTNTYPTTSLNTWITDTNDGITASQGSVIGYYVFTPTTSTTHYFFCNATGTFSSGGVQAFHWTGFAGTLVSGGAAKGANASGTTVQVSTTLTPAVGGVCVAMIGTGSTVGTSPEPTIDSGFVSPAVDYSDYLGGTAYGVGDSYWLSTSASAIQPTWTVGTSGDLINTVTCFQ